METMEDSSSEESDEKSLDNMMQHIEEANKRDNSTSSAKRPRRTGLQRKVRQHHNVAILSKNYADRLDELVESEAITHRSWSELKSAESVFDAHGQLPIGLV